MKQNLSDGIKTYYKRWRNAVPFTSTQNITHHNIKILQRKLGITMFIIIFKCTFLIKLYLQQPHGISEKFCIISSFRDTNISKKCHQLFLSPNTEYLAMHVPLVKGN